MSTLVKAHSTPVMRRLGTVDLQLQENKRIKLGLAAARLDGILIRPGETFSFWRCVGPNSKSRGYLPGLILFDERTGVGIGGGICQMANLLNWMVLHSPLEVVERHHHSVDFFPDNLRRIPFGSGASVFYNYLDYQFRNPGAQTFQLRVKMTETHLAGELRAGTPLEERYEVYEAFHRFIRADGVFYRENVIARKRIRASDDRVLDDEALYHHCSRVLYDATFIPEFEELATIPDLSRPPARSIRVSARGVEKFSKAISRTPISTPKRRSRS